MVDRPGILARSAAIFGTYDVSLRVVQQTTQPGTGTARLEVMTHATTEASMAAIVAELEGSEFVGTPVRLMRVEGF